MSPRRSRRGARPKLPFDLETICLKSIARDPRNRYPDALSLAQATLSIMRQNLAWAAGYNLLGIPLAAGLLYPAFHLLLTPWLAAAAMALSSVCVLGNSLRLRGWRPS